MANTELEKFGEMLIDARNAGVREVFGWCFGGERPINPTKELKRILRFVDSLSKKQKRQLVSLVAYFIGASLYSVITRLENGENVYTFQLFMRNEEAGEVLEIVGDNVDNDLLHRYWEWESRYGAIEEFRGRFLSRDTFEGVYYVPPTLHKYRYADGNPIGLQDTSGYASLATSATRSANTTAWAAPSQAALAKVAKRAIQITASIISDLNLTSKDCKYKSKKKKDKKKKDRKKERWKW